MVSRPARLLSTGWTLSSDTHIVEPPDLFRARVPDALRDAAPHLEVVDGTEYWVAEGKVFFGSSRNFAPGKRFQPEAEQVPWGNFATSVDSSAFEPSAWLSAVEEDGVYGSVVYPSGTLAFLAIGDEALLDASLRAYNDWIEEFASADPSRIKPVALVIPRCDDVQASVREVEAMAARGFAGLAIPVRPLAGQEYDDPTYEPFWEAVEAAGLPLSMHIASQRTGGDVEHLDLPLRAQVNIHDYYIRAALTDMILSGVFVRHPDLKVVSVEHEGTWALHFLQRLDWHHSYSFRIREKDRLPNGTVPSDYFRRNVYISFTEDQALVDARHVIGVDHLMWGSDFPHPESLFPRSVRSLTEQLAAVPEDERYQMTVRTTAELYGFAPPPPAA